jgi:glycosyltransferase involved in cell wall biosynthesis
MSLASARGAHVAKSEALASFAVETTALYESADLLLPNSHLEARDLIADLAVTTPIRVVPNAADPSRFRRQPSSRDRSGVLCVGRIEPRKNQLRLIEALRGTSVQVTIVGDDHPDHRAYADNVRSAAGTHVRIIGHVSESDLVSLYQRARVHALPSEFETTGLVSLEAALCGCSIVTTSVGYAREYFRDFAWYCDPYDTASIRRAVLDALPAAEQPGLRQRILENYTWEHAAAATAAAYHDLVHHRL